MGMHLVYLPASLADYLAELMYHNDKGTIWTPAAGSRTECVVGLTDQQIRYLETLTAEDDGYIEGGVMWIGGTDYPIDPTPGA